MEFNKLELLIIRALKLNTNSNKKNSFYNKFLNLRNKVLNIQKNSLDQPSDAPSNNKKRNLDQPDNPNQKEPGKARKIIWSFIIIILVLGVLALIILSGFSFSATSLNAASFTENGTSSFKITTNTNQTRTIGGAPSTIYQRDSTLYVIYIENSFSGYYYSAIITDISVSNNTASVGNGSNTTGGSTSNLQKGLQIANLLVDGSGNVYENKDNNGSTTSGTTTFSLNSNLTSAMKLQGWSSNQSMSLPTSYSFYTAASLVLSILPFILLIGIIYYSMRKMGQAGGGQDNVFSIGKSQAKLAKSTVLFSDVAGIEEEKEELIEIVDYLKRPDRYAAMGARVPKGVILYGPPGTGKTLLAKAVAGEAKVPFFQVSGSAFEDMLVGVGAKRVRDLFNKAVKSAPAIIFIDEIDSVGSKRGKFETTAGSLADQTLNQLLAEMDGFNTKTGVIVMAATNRLDVLDDALLRPGRFDRHIQVNLPDIKERVAILKIHSRNKNISETVDLEDIARRTPGFSGAQLENVLNEATLLAVRRNKKSIYTEELDEAIDRVIAGPAKKTRVISLEEKRQIAFHEAGHAIVGMYTKGSEVVEKITIIPRGQAAGYTLSVPEIQELSIQKKSDLLGMVAGLLGGRASEEINFGKEFISTGAANDLYKATNIVRAMVTQFGMSPNVGLAQYYPSEGTVNPYQSKNFSESTSQLIDKEIERIFKERYEYAYKIIKEHNKEVELIVESLLLLETIVKPQIDFIHKYKQLPKEALEKKKELEEKKKAEDLIRKAKKESEASSKEEKEMDVEKKVQKPSASSTEPTSKPKKAPSKESSSDKKK
ncbi:ATP-dependent zinc metalloprotease FtsH [Malacoplasma penetrans]|uniref:ATP-dependent zinc metalloprotease FtsH n=1 Tax=Malacoplasma penetrans TaxID=28227 RepID=UPI001011BA92|nr:ATP-dependent zinc metalloprotease FtsH [Malacoplasma penetrans]RXY96863.1 ATP-dependent zinc metalloprotease FtsH [Malacoplasma penetrans]